VKASDGYHPCWFVAARDNSKDEITPVNINTGNHHSESSPEERGFDNENIVKTIASRWKPSKTTRPSLPFILTAVSINNGKRRVKSQLQI
jgi:hypothetical protein